MSTLLRMLLAQQELLDRRGTEASVWQGLSISLMREVGAQLRTARFSVAPEKDLGPGVRTHDPYARPY